MQDHEKGQIDFYVQTNLGRLIQIAVRNRKAIIKDVLLPGERVNFGDIHDGFIAKRKEQARDKKKT